MKSNWRKKFLTFDEFVVRVYDIWGEREARGFVQLAVKPHLIEIQGQQRFAIS
jgi:hypothetical protein